MGLTAIQWTATPRADGTLAPGYSFNPWTGCSKVSPGCANCYAEPIANRFNMGSWGPKGERKVKPDKYWDQPLAWNRAAAKAGERRKVFCASMADVFEDLPELMDPRERLWCLIRDTPHLDWLLLTKRPENWSEQIHECLMVTPDRDLLFWLQSWLEGESPENVQMGVSVENQAAADVRIPLLLKIPAAVRFLSCEPLLGLVILHRHLAQCGCGHGHGFTACPNTGGVAKTCHMCDCRELRPLLHQVIAGGESGKHARRCDLAWQRSLLSQCKSAGVAFFEKQLGSNVVCANDEVSDWFDQCGHLRLEDNDAVQIYQGEATRILGFHDRHGGDPSEWPEDLRVREFPSRKCAVCGGKSYTVSQPFEDADVVKQCPHCVEPRDGKCS